MPSIRIDQIKIGEGRRTLNEANVESLKESIKTVGLQCPPTVRPDGTLIAGYHRVEACKRLGWTEIEVIYKEYKNDLFYRLAELDENLCSDRGTKQDKSNWLAERKQIYETLFPETKRGGAPGAGRGKKKRPSQKNDNLASFATDSAELEQESQPATFTENTAQQTGMSQRSVQRLIKIAEGLSEEAQEHIKGTSLADHQANLEALARLPHDKQLEIILWILGNSKGNKIKTVKSANTALNKSKQIESIKAEPLPLPTGKHRVIVIDPPWPYGTEYDSEGRRSGNPYPEMSLEDIKSLPVPKLAHDDCILWLWTTHRFMRHSFALLDAWGFRDVSILTWKKNKMGTGNWLRSKSEFCIMAVRGTPKVDLKNQTTVLDGKMREHSRKPEEFFEMVESLCPGSKLEMFSREERVGWSSWGDETSKYGDKDGGF